MSRPRRRVQLVMDPTEINPTRQSFKEECDINLMMAKFQRTGQLTHVRESLGTYGDYSNVDDYQSALNNVKAAESAFAAMPANIRDRFQNDAAQFLEFMDNPDNQDEAEDLGLVKSKIVPKRPEVAPEPERKEDSQPE